MKQPFTSICKLLLLALAWGPGTTAWGQTYTPVALTGFTHDIIANGPGAVSATTTADIDGAAATGGTGYCLMAQDYVGPTGQVPNTTTYPATTHPALENSGLITSALNSAITYQLASYSANNALRLYGAAATGTLSFATPSAASELYVVGTSGNATSVLDITVNFAGGTSQVFTSQSIGDWFATGQTNVVREKLGRVSRGDNTVQYTSSPAGPRLYQLRLAIDPTNVTKNITGITFSKPLAAGNTVLLAVTAGVVPVCAAVPASLAAVATTTSGGTTALTSACVSTSIYLSVSGLASQAGYTYQWQSSANGTTWTDITGATSATYTATGQTAATSYRLLVTCLYAGTGNVPVPAAPVQIAQNALTSCYCVPPARTSTSTLYATMTTVALPGEAGTTLTNAPGLLTSTSASYVSANYAVYPASTTTATLARNTDYTLTVSVPASTRASAWVDFDQNGSFDASEFVLLKTATGALYATAATSLTAVITPPTGALNGVTRMRIRTDFYNNTVLNTAAGACASTTYGQAVDYFVSVAPSVACTGTPPAISVVSSATAVCGGTALTLTASGVAAGTTGLSYQWQSRTGTNAFANLGTAQTSVTYTVASQAVATDYRVVVTCTASSQSATSNTVSVAQTPFANCYCTVISTGTNEYIKSVTLPGAPGFTNATGSNSTDGYGDFTANSAYTTTLNRGATANLSVTVRSNNTGSQGGLWVDYDHNGVFDASEYTLVGNSSLTGTDVVFPVALAVPTTALAGPTRMRVRWRNSSLTSADACTTNTATGCVNGCNWYGETEDYLVTISATPLATNSANAAAKLALFPNPTQAVTTLSGAEAGTLVQVLDVLGRAVFAVKADATGKATLALPTSLAKGVYVVRAGQQTARLVLE
jgi:hypothetical protein